MTSQAYATALDPAPAHEARVLRPVDVDAGADAGRMLVALHERVERQFEAYEAAEGSAAARYRAVAAVARALATHVAVEDELLYPALQAHTGRHDVEIERQLQQDHLLDLVMVELGGMIPSDRSYDGKVRVLVQVFRQHARDAETLIGQYMSRYLTRDEREELGLRMLERVGQLEGRPRPGW
jgi:hemerythrin HHE cation binding domain-containing protein